MKVESQIIIDACNSSLTMTEACAKVGSLNKQTFRKYAIKLGVWKTNQGKSGNVKPRNEGNGKFALQDILEGKHPGYSSHKLRLRLIAEGIKEDKCECCGTGNIWQGKPLSLQLDHIDGNHNNNILKNLQIVCPNCHTQTDTHGSKRLKK